MRASVGRDADQVIRNDPEPDPSLHSVVAGLSAPVEAMSSFAHTDAALAPGSPSPFSAADVLGFGPSVLFSASQLGLAPTDTNGMNSILAWMRGDSGTVRANKRLGDIYHSVQQHAEESGFSVIRQFVGHGIGRQMHEDPQLPNFGLAGTGPELKPGMTLAIEPMVNQGEAEVYIKPDGWTVCTSDGSLSAYFEHTVAITKTGPRVLTSANGFESKRVAV